MLTTANPAVRVAADWNKPSRKRKAGGRTVTVESLSCARLVKVVDWSADCAYIENDEKDQIYAVQTNKHSEQPPIGFTRKEQREASTGVIQKEAQFFPNTASFRNKLGAEPDDESEHAWKASVSNDNKKSAQ